MAGTDESLFYSCSQVSTDDQRHVKYILREFTAISGWGDGEQMPPTPKMKAAAKDLQRRYLKERRDLRQDGNYEPVRCDVKLDRIIITAREVPLQAVCAIPGYRAKPPRRLWRKLYSVVDRILGADSIRKIIIESVPNAGWLPKFRITIEPRDETGLLFADLCLILELLTHFKIVLIEISLDFPLRSVVDPWFVRRHLLCGKTRMRVGPIALHEKWGTSRSSKVVRSYGKIEILRFRIELQLHSRFLRQHGINHTSDFAKLATILPRKHVYFASLDGKKLREQLKRSRLSHKTQTEILKAVAKSRNSLWSTLRLLRSKWHFTNVRRLLTPLAEMNQIVIAALNEWATQWQKPSSLRGKDKTKEGEAQ